MTQQSLFDLGSRFDGLTYEPKRDQARLSRQAQQVWDLMKDGRWRTLQEISSITFYPQASISARLRDFRKERCGSVNVERRHVRDGLWEYKVSK